MLKKFFNKTYSVEAFKKLLLQKPPNTKEIKQAISSGLNINTIDENGDTFLHFAIKKNLPSAGKILIESGIDINIKDKNNHTPLYVAVDKGNRIIVQSLLKHNANVSELNDNRTLLQDAVLNGDKHIVHMLLSTKININNTDSRGRNVAFDAISNGNEKIIDMIIEVKGLNLNQIDNDQQTILHLKNVIEDDHLAKKLISKGADPTILDGEQKSYLLYAALRGMETDEIIDIIIENGYDINVPVRDQNSILMEIMFAFTQLSPEETQRRKNLLSMADKLVSKGLDVKAINNKGETVLFEPARKMDFEACKFLINKGVPLNIVNYNGETVLSELVYKGLQAWEIISLLLQNGASLSHKNKFQQTIVEVVNELILYTNENIDFIYVPDEKINFSGQYMRLLKEILEVSHFNVNTLSSEGEPIFFKSLLFGNRELFSLYCQYGADVNTQNIRGNTIFSRYVGKMSSQETLPKDFRDVIIMLIDKKIDVNQQDKEGKTILSKLIDLDNIRAFRILFGVAKFNFLLQDNRGFTLIHNCISTSNITIIKLIDQIEPRVKNIPDNSGILPITYAALFGKVDIVLELINLESNFKSNKVIPKAVKLKLRALLKNLDKLTDDDEDKQHKLNILKDQITRDFT